MFLVAGMTKLVVAGTLAAVGALLADHIAARIFARPELAEPLRLAAILALGLALFEFTVAVLQARERFGAIFGASAAAAVLKLLPLAVLTSAGALTLRTASLALVASTYATALAGAVLVRGAWGGRAAWRSGVAAELARYSRWFVPATVLVAVMNGLDVIAMAFLAGPAATGVYASARMLAAPLGLAGIAFGTVLLPKFGRAAAERDIGPQVGTIQLGALAAGVVVASALVALAPVALPLVYGQAYGEAVLVLQILAVAYTVEVIAWPAFVRLMVADRPAAIAKTCLATLVLSVAAYAVAVPALGAPGAAGVYLGGRALMLGTYLVLGRVWAQVGGTA